jgi:digeranylgeranylglycerophospholipid reductase
MPPFLSNPARQWALHKTYDAVIAGGGPAGLSAARVLAARGHSTLILEQNHEIGSPIRTSGGSFPDELAALGIPAHLYHLIGRARFLSPNNAASFEYPTPKMCVIDVRGVFQYLAQEAIAAGAEMRLSTSVTGPTVENGRVNGVRTKVETIGARVVIDATGYRSVLLKQAGLDPGFERFGVGAEYDLYAPHCDQNEVLLLVGDQVAPSGYAWVFPWGKHRVRVGVGVIHPDSRANPGEFLDQLVSNAAQWGVNLKGAQPMEHHQGLIPSERFAQSFAGNGILGAGDSAGHASSLLGEGIRWAIQAGRMAGETAADGLAKGDVSRAALAPFEKQWKELFGPKLRLGHHINRRIARWDNAKWDRRVELLKKLTPDQFVEALKTNLTSGWVWDLLRSHPSLLVQAAKLR